MSGTLAFARTLFFFLSIFFMTAYMVGGIDGYTTNRLIFGMLLGSALGSLLIGLGALFRRCTLRSWNTVIVGLLFGYLMGTALNLIFSALLDLTTTSSSLPPRVLEMLKLSLFLFGTYLGTLLTVRASDEIHLSIPFVRFTSMAYKKRDLITDSSVLSDARIVDLAASGIIDNHLVVPRFLINELYAQAENPSLDEPFRNKAKRALDVIKKLEALPHLELRYHEADFAELNDLSPKIIRLARLSEANILTADLSRIQAAAIEGVRFINLHTLSNALKPLMQAGEQIKIKIQRYGKEPRQGVGYLDDGTMVVVNGGGQFIGAVIDAQVLSVKHTASGRMVFCNACDDEEEGYMAAAYPGYHGDEEQ